MDLTKPTLLDGLVTPGGQGQEGNFLVELPALVASKYYSTYVCRKGCSLSNEDYLILWEDEGRDRMSLRDKYFHDLKHEQVMDKIDWDATQRLMEAKLKQQRLNAKKAHAGHELGAREFTLTYSPKWFDDLTARDTMRKAIDKIIKYYKDDIIQLRAVGEVGSNGLSHIHCFYKLRDGLKITDKNFKRAYKHWNPKKVTSRTGHEGGHHANVRNEADFQGYIDKDVDTAWLDVYYPPASLDRIKSHDLENGSSR